MLAFPRRVELVHLLCLALAVGCGRLSTDLRVVKDVKDAIARLNPEWREAIERCDLGG